jgi:CheY-like chemotaxis protein
LKVESSDTEQEQGTGLGLAIVARIVRNMNGQLRAESEEGRGSKFTFAFNFPLPTAAQESAFLEVGNATPQPDTSQMTYSVPLSSDKTSEKPSAVRRLSNDSVRSRGSAGSGKSEIDQLVEMIASPSLEEASRTNQRIKRRDSPTTERGEYTVQDSGVPIRSVKVDEEEVDVPSANQVAGRQPAITLSPKRPQPRPSVSFKLAKLQVLVAEDDPVNQAIMKKRLEIDGHDVMLTKNGLEAVEAFENAGSTCDIILMDLQVCWLFGIATNAQMPILDGVSATKRIREAESSNSRSGPRSHGLNNNRVPIFAVSASLPESRSGEITNAEFDGWILKPINFRRLGELMAGIFDFERRRRDLYVGANSTKMTWERGGWLVPPPESAIGI